LEDVSKGYTAFQSGDVLLAKITPCFENGKAAVVGLLSSMIGFGSTEFHVLRPSPAIDAQFLFHLVWNPKFRRLGTLRMTGSAGQKRVPTAFLADFEFVLPPLNEQKRIAVILDKADSLRRKRHEAIRLSDDFLRASFFELFGNPNVNDKHWPERAIADISKVTTGNTPSRDITAYYGDAIEWIKSDNINTPNHGLTPAREGLSEFGSSIGRTVPAGSTLMTCIAGSASCIGNVALSDRKIAFNQQINAMTPTLGIEPEFLYGLLLYSKIRIQAASTNSMKGMVSKGVLEKVQLIWPPAELQKKFVTIFKHVERLRSRMEDAEASILVTSLQSKLLA
jgi:type I restriction enzyme S subunit